MAKKKKKTIYRDSTPARPFTRSEGVLELAASTLEAFHEALLDGGKLDGSSVDRRTGAKFRTLARSVAKKCRETIGP